MMQITVDYNKNNDDKTDPAVSEQYVEINYPPIESMNIGITEKIQRMNQKNQIKEIKSMRIINKYLQG